MIAEIHGKISSKGSNLSDRLEDNLTGDIFGSLRYLPFDLGIAQILKAANIEALTECVNNTQLSFWGDKLKFWPYHQEGEIDAFLELDNAVVGIEVKYMSGLSSDDDVDNSLVNNDDVMEKSRNQLSRESRIVKEWATENRKAFLIFIAKESDCAAVCNNAKQRVVIESGVELSYVSWEEILTQLKSINSENPFYAQILSDIVKLLMRKDFERFKDFYLSDNISITSDEYFSFECSENRFSFKTDEIIDGGIFYEYK